MPETTTRTGWRDVAADAAADVEAEPAPPPSRTLRHASKLQALVSTRLCGVLVLVLATAVVYGPSSLALGELWSDPGNRTFSHGFLILATSLWILFRHRASLAAAPVQREPLALPVLLVAAAMWLFFWRAAIQDLHVLMLPVLALLGILAAFGRSTARAAALPLLYIDFAMPIWGDLHRPLQLLSIKVVGMLIGITGLPALMNGDMIRLPAGTLVIEEGCSGLNFLMVGLAMAVLYGELGRDPPRRRFAWIGILGAIALVANWLRIYGIAVLGYATDMRSPIIANHYWYGWALFAIFFAGFLWIAGRLTPPAAQPHEPGRELGARTGNPAAVSTVSARRFAVTLMGLTMLPLLVYGADVARGLTEPGVAIEWPPEGPGWHLASEPGADPAWSPVFAHATARSERRYLDSTGASVDIFEVAYRTQRQSGKLLAYGNSLLGVDETLQTLAVRIVEGPAGAWREQAVRDASGEQWLIWSRYRIGSREFVRPRLSQLWYGVATFVGEPVSSLSAMRAACRPSCAAARERLQTAARLIPSVHPTAARTGGETS